MRCRIYAVALAIVLVTPCIADTYTVNNDTDGVVRTRDIHTLRWAIEKVNGHQGPDESVFAKPMRIILTLRLITYSDVILTAGATNNTIGGTETGAGNIFGGGGEAGITVEGAGTESNQILGNYFGVGPDGNRLIAAQVGVQAVSNAGSLRIGTHVPATRNYFCLLEGSGVVLSGGGEGSITENNCFGESPTGARLQTRDGITLRGGQSGRARQ